VTPGDRRLVALAAALLPDRARALLGRAPASAAAEEGGRLAALPGPERLAALAAALHVHRAPARAALVTAAERATVGAHLAALARGEVPSGVTPALLRLLRERLG
jgi:hypothetical protein